jgi:hypothetical protein
MLFTWFIIFVLFTLLGILVYLINKEYKRTKAYKKDEDSVSTKKPLKKERPTVFKKHNTPKVTQDTLQRKEKLESTKIETKVIKLPIANYPQFDHSRLIKMGLSEEESRTFIQELIAQIKIQIPLIKEAMYALDFHNMERLTHSIKGSATNIGTGGVSDLLVDYNTYLKTGTEISIAQRYFMYLQHQLKMLEKQYTD